MDNDEKVAIGMLSRKQKVAAGAVAVVSLVGGAALLVLTMMKPPTTVINAPTEPTTPQKEEAVKELTAEEQNRLRDRLTGIKEETPAAKQEKPKVRQTSVRKEKLVKVEVKKAEDVKPVNDKAEKPVEKSTVYVDVVGTGSKQITVQDTVRIVVRPAEKCEARVMTIQDSNRVVLYGDRYDWEKHYFGDARSGKIIIPLKVTIHYSDLNCGAEYDTLHKQLSTILNHMFTTVLGFRDSFGMVNDRLVSEMAKKLLKQIPKESGKCSFNQLPKNSREDSRKFTRMLDAQNAKMRNAALQRPAKLRIS
ncbi:MAG: hypothetical protein V1492_00880 [Candidatus Micrarchaeota archaeon]